jgi:hypothetical protein
VIWIKGTRFVYFPVPKCACTSIKTAIFQHNGPPRGGMYNETIGVHGWRAFETVQFPSKRRAMLLSLVAKPFCVVRDPIERFVSGYRNRIVHLGELGEVPEINDFALSLEKHIAANGSVHHHFSPVVAFLGRNPRFYDRVFRMGEIDQIPKYLGVPMTIPREQTQGPKIRVSALSPEAIGKLRRFYSEDYAVWGSYIQSATQRP